MIQLEFKFWHFKLVYPIDYLAEKMTNNKRYSWKSLHVIDEKIYTWMNVLNILINFYTVNSPEAKIEFHPNRACPTCWKTCVCQMGTTWAWEPVASRCSPRPKTSSSTRTLPVLRFVFLIFFINDLLSYWSFRNSFI